MLCSIYTREIPSSVPNQPNNSILGGHSTHAASSGRESSFYPTLTLMRITIRHQDHCHYHTFTTTFPSLAVLNILDQHARCQIRTTVCTYRSTQNRIEVLFIKILPVQSTRVDTEVSIGSDPTYRVVMSACFRGESLLGVFSPLIHHVHLQFTRSVYKHLTIYPP
jgi:hypothetical protein